MLRDDITGLKGQIRLFQDGKDSRHVAKDVQLLLDEIGPRVINLKLCSSQRLAMTDLQNKPDLDLSKIVPNLKICIEELVKFNKLWSIEVSTIRQNGLHTPFFRAFNIVNEALSNLLTIAWDSSKQEFLNEYKIEERKLDIAGEGIELRSEVRDYRKVYQKLKDLSSQVPVDQETVQSINSILDRLKLAKEKINAFELPPEVEDFYRDLNHFMRSEVPLSKLSDDLFTWLKANEDLDNFVIKRAMTH